LTVAAAPLVRASRHAWYVAIVLCFAHAVSFLDRFVMSLALVPLKAEMALSDTQLGLLVGMSFVLLYSLAGIPLGLLADIVNRRRMIALGVLAWSLATAATAFAESFPSLFAARLAVGLGEAALVPAGISLIGSYFPKTQLGQAVSIFTAGSALGRTLAFLGGGVVLALLNPLGGMHVPLLGQFRPWQSLFLLAAVPGFVLVAMMFTVREPARPARDAAARHGLGDALAHMRRHAGAYALTILAGTCCILVIQNQAAWAASFFVRLHGMGQAQAGYVIGLASLVSAVLGSLYGGWLTDRLQARGVTGAVGVTICSSLLLSIPAVLVMYLAEDRAVSIAGFVVSEFLVTSTAPAAVAGVQLLTPDRHRGIISAIFQCTLTLLAVGVGPTLVGVLTDHVFVSPLALGKALLSSHLCVAILGILLAGLGRRVFQQSLRTVTAGPEAP
jgi:MFS family permease